jgi:acyl-CoA dehydrogenase
MNFTYTKKVTDLMEQLTVFMDKHIYSNDQAYRDHFKTTGNIWQQPPLISDLKKKAKADTLVNLITKGLMIKKSKPSIFFNYSI